MSLEKTEELYEAKIVRLAYACPLHRKNLNCPLSEIRKKEFSEKIQWLNRLSFADKQEIYQRHTVCFSKYQ